MQQTQTPTQSDLNLNKASQPQDELANTPTVTDQSHLNYIKPVPTQILPVYEDKHNQLLIHIELDPVTVSPDQKKHT